MDRGSECEAADRILVADASPVADDFRMRRSRDLEIAGSEVRAASVTATQDFVEAGGDTGDSDTTNMGVGAVIRGSVTSGFWAICSGWRWISVASRSRQPGGFSLLVC